MHEINLNNAVSFALSHSEIREHIAPAAVREIEGALSYYVKEMSSIRLGGKAAHEGEVRRVLINAFAQRGVPQGIVADFLKKLGDANVRVDEVMRSEG